MSELSDLPIYTMEDLLTMSEVTSTDKFISYNDAKTIKQKQLTEDQLREQFEGHFNAIMKEASDFQIELMWESWKGCSIANGIINDL